jgi:prepilin-type N-terminal cleavage/methylation domain-containing protein/prepilin-type processing-associated H-X9-DG protein
MRKGQDVSNKRHKDGFTLIELLVVLAIIGLLLSIVMPSLRKVKRYAQQMTCAAHQKGFGVAFLAYAEENKGRSHWGPNRGYWYIKDQPGQMYDKDNINGYWGIAYLPYAQNMDVFHCPSSRYKLQTWNASDSIEIYYWAHFGLNGFAANRILGRIQSPGTMIVMQDHFEQKLDNNGDMFHIKPGNPFNLTQWRVANRDKFPDALLECFRHGRTSDVVQNVSPYSPEGTGYSNTLWLDGHVSPIQQTEGRDVLIRWYTGGVGDGTQSNYVATREEAAQKVY